jgi:glycosyltransferase involved in cell wall biosynthesis
MKVLHVTPSYYPAIQFGGPVRSVHALNNELIKAGINVNVVTTNAGLTDRTDIPLKKITHVDEVPIIYFPFIGYQHYNFSISLMLYIFKNVKKYDLVHITAVWNFPVLVAALACIWNRKPYILSPRGTIYPETIAHRSGIIKKIYYFIIGGIAVKKANLLHFTTQDEAQKVTKFLKLKNKYVTIYNGLSNPIYSNKILLESKPYILFLGRIDKKKGLDILVHAYSKYCKTSAEYNLVIAGPDNEGYLSTIESLCNDYGIREKVIFLGEVEGDTKWNLYKNSSLFILSSYSENFGMTVAEAMLIKCPILISDQVGLSEIIKSEDAGWICKPEVDDLLEKMEKALESKELSIKKAERAHAYALEYFNITSVAKQFIHAYSSMLTKE